MVSRGHSFGGEGFFGPLFVSTSTINGRERTLVWCCGFLGRCLSAQVRSTVERGHMLGVGFFWAAVCQHKYDQR